MKGRVVALLVSFLVAGACGSGGGETGDAASSGDGKPHATLGIISTNIETALEGAAFEAAEEGQRLAAGDRVRTDETGFAEITYHDGSWQRVEARATLTVVRLTERGEARSVSTAIDVGRSWNNVRELTGDGDAFEVETPVATAAVRGTQFATDCPTPKACTFTVVQGTVLVTPAGGDPIEVRGGQSLVVGEGRPIGDPVELDPDDLAADEWVARNRDLDEARDGGDAPDDEGAPGAAGPVTSVPDACTVFSPEEATVLANQRDDGRTLGPMRQSVTREPDPSARQPDSTCFWEREQEVLELVLSVQSDFESCQAYFAMDPLLGTAEPLAVGDRSAWYPDERAVLVFADGACIMLRHRSDAGPTGRDEFVDAASRVLARISG